MAKEYRKKVLALTAALVLAGSTPLADVFTLSAQAKDGEEDSSSHESEDDGGSDQSSGKDESSKKAEEKKKESEKKAAEIKRESAKRALEVKMESEKKKAEIMKKSQEREAERSASSTLSRRESEDDVNDDASEDETENETESADDSSSKDLRTKGVERRSHAAEKIAEVEKYILEKQSEGKDMTVAFERLAQAKSMLSAAGETEDSRDGDEAEDLVKESLKLAHTAKEDDAHDINDVDKYIRKASDRIDQAKKKLSRLAAAGGETTTYQSMIDAAVSDLDSAKSLLSQGSLLESSAAAKKAESEAKSAKRAIESAGLALGLHDDELSGEHKSAVAKAVEDLLYVADTEGDNAIGTKIREIAKQQRDSADKVDTFIDDAQSRSGFSEFVLGPKYRDLNGISQQISDNGDRIRSLEESASQLSDEDLKQVVQEHIDALNEENDKLQSFVDGKEKQRGIFGWVFRLMQQ